MAALKIVLALLLPPLLFSLFKSSHATGFSIYWGQKTPMKAPWQICYCNSGNYQFVNIAFLSNFGSGQNLQLNLKMENVIWSKSFVTIAIVIHLYMIVNTHLAFSAKLINVYYNIPSPIKGRFVSLPFLVDHLSKFDLGSVWQRQKSS